MKKLSPVIMLLLFLGTQLSAQNKFQWARAAGGVVDNPLTQGPYNSVTNDMQTDKWGNIYMVGQIYDDIQFTGTTQTFPYYGAVDAFIVKYDKCGNFQWAIINGGISTDENFAIAIDTAGYIYVGGQMYSDGTTPIHVQTSLHSDTVMYNTQMLFTKYDPNGNLIWERGLNKGWTALWQSLRFRHDGELITMMDCATGGSSWQSMNVPAVSTQGVALMFATLDPQNGNVIQSAVLDTLPFQFGLTVNPWVLDENDNIYLPIEPNTLVGSGPVPNAHFLDTVFTIPYFSNILLKADKNFHVLTYQFDSASSVVGYLAYSQGALYTTGAAWGYSHYMSDSIGDITSITGFPDLAGGNMYRVLRLDTGPWPQYGLPVRKWS